MKVWTKDVYCSLVTLIGGSWKSGLQQGMLLAVGGIVELTLDGQCITTSSFQHLWQAGEIMCVVSPPTGPVRPPQFQAQALHRHLYPHTGQCCGFFPGKAPLLPDSRAFYCRRVLPLSRPVRRKRVKYWRRGSSVGWSFSYNSLLRQK